MSSTHQTETRLGTCVDDDMLHLIATRDRTTLNPSTIDVMVDSPS